MQANIWQQTLVPEPIELDPVTLGWTKDATGGLMPLLTQLPPAPEMVIVMVKCGCQKGLCNAQSSCKQHNLTCTALCKCIPERCQNQGLTKPDSVNDYDDDIGWFCYAKLNGYFINDSKHWLVCINQSCIVY